MKTPGEIKKGLVCCGEMTARQLPCKVCPYNDLCTEAPDECHLLPDALAYINQLEERIDLMKLQMRGDCGTCKHRDEYGETCKDCLYAIQGNHPNWEYEGLPGERTDDHEKPVQGL